MKIVDMHCDTVSIIAEKRKAGIEVGLYENDFHIDIKKMKKGNYILQNFAMFIDMEKCQDPSLYCMEMIDCYEQLLLENKEHIAAVYSYSDIEKNYKSGKLSALLTIEEGGACKGSIDLLKEFYSKGVRMMTLLWNYENELGYPNTMVIQSGLKEKGLEFIWSMEEMGMIVDVSHMSDRCFYDVIKHSKKPFVASHSNARVLSPHGRNLTDDMIEKIAMKGGLIGLNFCPYFLDRNTIKHEAKSKVEYMIEHIKYIINIGGINCLGLGSDFDGMEGDLELEDASYLPMLEHKLIEAGFKSNEIEAIFYKNILNLYKELL
ncbi:MAG: membrane dipeptidase [Clostridiales bacterium]|nr:membrane dipeptidase [Clostridiales bacterium]